MYYRSILTPELLGTSSSGDFQDDRRLHSLVGPKYCCSSKGVDNGYSGPYNLCRYFQLEYFFKLVQPTDILNAFHR